MDTNSSTSVVADLAGHVALSDRFQLHPGLDQYMLGFGDAALRTAAAVSNGHLIPRSLTLSFCIPDERRLHRIEPSAYLRSLLIGLRRTTELLDEDREVMHVVLAEGLPEYLGVKNLGNLLDAVPRYLRTAAFPDVSVTVRLDRQIAPALLVAAGCTRCTLLDGAAPAAPAASAVTGNAIASAGFHTTAYQPRRYPHSSGDHPWPARVKQALDWQPDQVLLPWTGQGGGADTAMHLIQAVALLEQHGYIAGGADAYVKREHAMATHLPTGARYCDLHGKVRSERTDMIGIGQGATSQVGDVYCRTSGDYLRWSAGLETGHLCIERGLILSADEKMRAEVMQSLACAYQLDTEAMGALHEPLFANCLEQARPRIASVLEAKLACWDGPVLRLTPLGKPLWRAVAACFRSPDFSALPRGM